jgi:hypothetical protein
MGLGLDLAHAWMEVLDVLFVWVCGCIWGACLVLQAWAATARAENASLGPHFGGGNHT